MMLLGFDREAAINYSFKAPNLHENDPAFEKITDRRKPDDYTDFMKVAFTNALQQSMGLPRMKNI